MLTEKDKEFIAQLNESFVNDDNCHTANPIYEVRSKIKIYGFHKDYADNFVWVIDEGDCLYDYEDIRNYFDDNDIIYEDSIFDDHIDLEDKLEDLEIRKVYYKEIEETHQSFLTRGGAEHYIMINKHNIEGKPYIYVESLYRNYEMQAIIEILKKLKHA